MPVPINFTAGAAGSSGYVYLNASGPSSDGGSVHVLVYSHTASVAPPAGVSVDVQDPTKFSVSGTSIEDVGQVAANIRSMRPPEPYKGKGVMYRGERVRRKAGKAGKGAKTTA